MSDNASMTNFQPARFGKVAVVMGGWSAERDVSLMSGEQVLDALSSVGIDAHAVDAGSDIGQVLVGGGFDRAFIILHGRGGEDGTVQAALELAGVPYTGSGVLGSALAMDKWRSKALVGLEGIPTADSRRVSSLDEARHAAREIGYPVVVKPVHEGSSIGVSMVDSPEGLESAFAVAGRHGEVMVERRLTGMEVTVGILGEQVLPAVSMSAVGEFYDYHAKYVAQDTEYRCPAPLDDSVRALIERQAMAAFLALGCSGWGRVDFILDEGGVANFVECNTAPGMTSHSLVPIAARENGLDFPALCVAILADTLREPASPVVLRDAARPDDDVEAVDDASRRVGEVSR